MKELKETSFAAKITFQAAFDTGFWILNDPTLALGISKGS